MLPQGADERLVVVPVASDVLDGIPELRTTEAAAEDRDLIAPCQELLDDQLAEELRAANDQDAHADSLGGTVQSPVIVMIG